MDIQLLQGEFSSKDALDLITKMLHVKIKYHEDKIVKNDDEDDIKYRETKIKRLQKELYELRNDFEKRRGKIELDATIKID